MGLVAQSLFCMHSEGIDPSNRADFHRALSRLPTSPQGGALGSAFGNLLFGTLRSVLFGT
jgi:hypothetical protein